jgi:hypothetical protein
VCPNAYAQTAQFSGVQITVPTSALNYNYGGAVDGSGNVYVADSGHSRVLKETLSGGAYSQTTAGQGLYFPFGVAVDSVGDVYVADSFNARVLEDAIGNLYIADSSASTVYKETLLPSGSYAQSTIGSSLSNPFSCRGGWERERLYRRLRPATVIEGDAVVVGQLYPEQHR